jgi:hypothetical protein
MKKLGKALGAVAIAGAIAAGGSAFTASNTISSGVQTVGYVSQAISGVTATTVTYNTDTAKQNITSVDLDLNLDTTSKIISIAFGDGLTEPTPAQCHDAVPAPVTGTYVALGTHTTYHCVVAVAVNQAEKFVLVAS